VALAALGVGPPDVDDRRPQLSDAFVAAIDETRASLRDAVGDIPSRSDVVRMALESYLAVDSEGQPRAVLKTKGEFARPGLVRATLGYPWATGGPPRKTEATSQVALVLVHVRDRVGAGVSVGDFATHLSRLGIPVIDLDGADVERDLDDLDAWLASS
jgi:hypothetical protein